MERTAHVTVTPATIRREAAIAGRVRAHNLAKRLSRRGGPATAAGIAALQDFPPGNAALSLLARVESLPPEAADTAKANGALWAVWGPRGAAYVVPRKDATVFTAGSLPADEASLEAVIGRFGGLFRAASMTAGEALRVIADAVVDILAGGAQPKSLVSAELGGRVPRELEPWCAGCQAHHPPDTVFRLAVVAAGARIAATDPAVLAPGPRRLWDIPAKTLADAQVELARRFVHAFGPTTPGDLSAWAGIGTADARARFAALDDELAALRLEGKRSWVLAADLAAGVYADPSDDPITGVRLLPGSDEFLAQRDRKTLLPDEDVRRRVWRPLGKQGVVLVDGAPAALWRPAAKSSTLVITCEPLRRLAKPAITALEEEAEAMARFRGREKAKLVVARS